MNAESIHKLLVRKGITATIYVYPEASFNPNTNINVKKSAIEYQVKIIPPYRYISEAYKQTSLISYGEGLTGIANHNLEFEVKIGLQIKINNKIWTVTGVTPIQDNTGILMYTLNIESSS